MNFYKILIVGGGGCIGSMVRYMAVQAVDKKLNSFFPYGTLLVNITGSFLLGAIIAVTLKRPGTDHWRLLLGTGFCGGFTTFSAFTFENLTLIEQKMLSAAMLYSLISLVLGFVAVWCGMIVGKIIS